MKKITKNPIETKENKLAFYMFLVIYITVGLFVYLSAKVEKSRMNEKISYRCGDSLIYKYIVNSSNEIIDLENGKKYKIEKCKNIK